MKGLFYLRLFCVLCCLASCGGYRILGVFPFHAKSHFVMFEGLMKGLARKGHRVDAITAFPQKKPLDNYYDTIVLPQPVQLINNLTYDFIEEITTQTVVQTVAIRLGGNTICEYLGKPEFQKLMRHPPTDPPYDVVLIEVFASPCFGIFGHLLNTPVVGVSSSALYPWMDSVVANPQNLAIMPNNLLNYPQEMTFWERTWNVIDTFQNKLRFHYLMGKQDDIIRTHVGPGMPSVREIESDIAIVLVNTHISVNGIKPMTPALIEVGGLHVPVDGEDGEELPPKLTKWMNDSTDGFVYFSFGSMMKIETFPLEVLDVFYKSLAKIAPIRVLMKIPDPEALPSGLSKNILTMRWVSQVKVLQHPNIKAFVTHGGLMGSQEAIACGVPMIGIPLFGDQFINIDTYVRKKIAIRLNHNNISEQEMDTALKEILWNPIYRESVKRLSRKFLDRPLSAMDTAIYWIEYVIRNGKDSLRSPALKLTWWQLALIDVYAFLLLTSVCVSYIIYVTLHLLLKSRKGTMKSSKLD